jgi:hypothetical protein
MLQVIGPAPLGKRVSLQGVTLSVQCNAFLQRMVRPGVGPCAPWNTAT